MNEEPFEHRRLGGPLRHRLVDGDAEHGQPKHAGELDELLALVGASSGGRRRRRGQSGAWGRQGGGSVLRLLTKLTLSREIWVRASSWLIAGVPSPGCGP